MDLSTSPHRVAVWTPYPVDSTQGNSISARRIATLLASSGIDARAIHKQVPAGTTCLIAINAWRSAKIVENFASQHPGGRIIAVLAGSDLYGAGLDACRPTLEAADLLVLAQAASLDALPTEFASKCTVIHKSASVEHVNPYPREDAQFLGIVLSNIREEKNPLLTLRAVANLPESIPIRIRHYGQPLDPKLAYQLGKEAKRSLHYEWMGGIPHNDALSILASADVFINTSNFEGGANAVCEAIGLGIPVLASRIPGNVGILGDSYLGFYDKGDAIQLRTLLIRCVESPEFVGSLNHSVQQLQPRVAPETERSQWAQAITSSAESLLRSGHRREPSPVRLAL